MSLDILSSIAQGKNIILNEKSQLQEATFKDNFLNIFSKKVYSQEVLQEITTIIETDKNDLSRDIKSVETTLAALKVLETKAIGDRQLQSSLISLNLSFTSTLRELNDPFNT